MQRMNWPVLVALIVCARPGWGGDSVFEYPTAVLDIHDADQSCWTGMDASGVYPVMAVPQRWLVGEPPSEQSAVTIPTDHWLDLGFSGSLADGDGNDILLVETGKAGEHALLFVTDGADREYLVARLEIEPAMRQEFSYLGVDLDGLTLPFEPRAVRIVALDMGGTAPGFDLCSVRARVSHERGAEARCPNPISGAREVDPGVQLSWVPGGPADRVVYLSDVASLVREGSDAAAYPPQPADVNTFDPPGLELGATYYWRVQELGGAGGAAHEGDVWSFTVTDHVTVDDFEAFPDTQSLWWTWERGGYADLFLEQETLETCQQSMVIRYYCDSDYESMVSRHFETAQDWTRGGARVLQLVLRGDLPDATRGELYVEVTDGVNTQLVSQAVLTALEGRQPWQAWRIPLAVFGDVDLTQVESVTVGVRSPASAEAGVSCSGVLHVAEISLYRILCLEGSRPGADLTADCRVDYRDLERMADDWLYEPVRTYEVAMPKDPILWYEFDGNANDRMGRAHGQVQGRCNFAQGVFGQAIWFTSPEDCVMIPEAASAFAGLRDAITIAFWQKGDRSGHANDTLLCSNYVYGRSNPALAVHLGCWQTPGQYRWDCGYPWSFENRLAGRHRRESDWAGRWNHWAFTKDTQAGPAGSKGCMAIYLNGELYDRVTGTDTPITGITSLEIGSGWYGYYDGLIDDVQIYDYALSAAEIAFVATDGAGVFERPRSPADLDADEVVHFRDFAALADQWLTNGLWP